MIVKIIQYYRKRMKAWFKKFWEMINNGLEELKKKQTEVKAQYWNEKCTRQNQWQNNLSIRTSKGLEDRVVNVTAMTQNKEKRIKRNEDSFGNLWDNIKHTNISIIGFPEGKTLKIKCEEIIVEKGSPGSSFRKESAYNAGNPGSTPGSGWFAGK